MKQEIRRRKRQITSVIISRKIRKIDNGIVAVTAWGLIDEPFNF